MTLDEFCEKLEEVYGDFTWEVCDEWYGAITGIKDVDDIFTDCLFCPITAVNFAVNGTYLNIGHYGLAGTQLGLSEEDINIIVDSSDNRDDTRLDYNFHDTKIRETLLRATKLLPQA